MFTGATTRIDIRRPCEIGGRQAEPLKPGIIYAAWHSQLAILLYVLRGKGILGLVSRSSDGEYAARVLRKFGFNTVRGSTSRGAAQSVMELIERADQGFHMAITPDGPKGPKRKVQQGVIYLAQKTGMGILPVGVALSRKITFDSWDNFELPLPFGKAAVVYGNPIMVGDGDPLHAKAMELEETINALGDQARQVLMRC
jgi:hypothetical protein